jgi:hypothetical protein
MGTFNENEHPRHRSGQFANKAQTAPEHQLAQTFSVPLADGQTGQLTEGVWDANAQEVFQSGQCLAFATALAERAPNAEVAILLREDGELSHAYALIVSGGEDWLVDSHGWFLFNEQVEARGLNSDSDLNFEYLEPHEATARAAGFDLLPEQDWLTARMFAGNIPTAPGR